MMSSFYVEKTRPLNKIETRTLSLWWIALFAVLLFLGLAGCDQIQPTSQPATEMQIDPVFQKIYDAYGGERVFGKPISPVMFEDGLKVQYFVNCKLIFDENAPQKQRFRFASLGLELGLQEPPVPPPADSTTPYVNGHIIFADFLPLYEELSPRNVGKPITEVRYNLIYRRYEQFFENMGFYRMEDSSEVSLIALGKWACKDSCMPVKVQNGIIELSNEIDGTFRASIERIGADLTGFAITPPYGNKSGKWEQIMENVVLVSETKGDSQSVSLLPVAEIVGVPTDPPKPYSGDSNMFFYPTQKERGYEIPLYFVDYIQKHGGFEVFGLPISSFSLLKANMYHQCFENACLTFDLSLQPGSRIHPEPLGRIYKFLHYEEPPPTPVVQLTPSPSGFEIITPQPQGADIVIQVWEQYPMLSANQTQTIWVKVLLGDQPALDMQPELILLLPNQSRLSYTMQPTGADGKTNAILPPITAQNGEVIDYKVCLPVNETSRFCVMSSFIIWDAP